MRQFKKIVLISSTFLIFSSSVYGDYKDESIRKITEAFCKAEFQGDEFEQRLKLIKFSPEREKKEKKRSGPASPWVVFWLWDPIYIITDYRIDGIKTKDKNATATVTYTRIAKSNGKGELIILDKEIDTVNLKFIYDGKRWWVYDPPPIPRISTKALIRLYEDEIGSLGDKWLQTATDAQKTEYLKMEKNLKLLKDLNNR